MIRYDLVCKDGHEFEGWFQDSAAYDAQRKLRKVRCPVCNSGKIDKQIMAPRVAAKGNSGPSPAEEARRQLEKLQAFVKENCEDVGDKFAEEARKIHYGETEERGIYGQTSDEEAKELSEEGVPFARIPLPKRSDA